MTSSSSASILWRRLDIPGHDAATFVERADGAEVRGMAVFHDEAGPTALHYRVCCDAAWRTIAAQVHGWCGTHPIELRIRRDRTGRWRLNGAACAVVAGCLDIDLSFTPATNLLPLRRLDLAVGHQAEVRSAWLAWPAATLTPLTQRYARQSATTYSYEAGLPGGDRFAGTLRVDPHGWVLDYPGLWQYEILAAADGAR